MYQPLWCARAAALCTQEHGAELEESRRSVPHLWSCSPRGLAAPRLAQGSVEVLLLVAAEKMTG